MAISKSQDSIATSMQPEDIIKSCFFSRVLLQEVASASTDPQKVLLILQCIWPDFVTNLDFNGRNYRCLLQSLRNELYPLKDHDGDFAVDSLTSTRDLLLLLRQWRSKTRLEILKELQRRFPDCSDHSILRSIELTIRLCIMINIQSRDISLSSAISTSRPIRWNDDVTLDAVIKAQFREEPPETASTSSKTHLVDPRFSAQFLHNVPGIGIEWTSDLASHLVYNRQRRTVLVYEHKIALLHQSTLNDPWIPHEIIMEALDTINLLFPFGSGATHKFLEAQGKNFHELGLRGRARQFDLRNYKYWRAALEELIEASEEPAYNWRALLRDRRNKIQYWTFCIAIFVLFLTVFGFALTIWSGVYTYRQYDLARLQACSGNSVPEAVQTKYCQ